MSSPYHGSQTQEFPSVSQCSSGYGSLAFHYQGRNRQSLQEPFSLNQILHPTELEQSGSNRLSVNVTVSCSEHTRHHRCNLRKDEASPQEVRNVILLDKQQNRPFRHNPVTPFTEWRQLSVIHV